MAKPQSLTSIAQSPEDERRSRMLKYTLAMSIRVVCIVLAMFVQGWLMWVCFAGAILLPYFAVVIANAAGSQHKSDSLPKAVAPTLVITAESFTKSQKPNDR
jgi:fatty acid desaturase